MAPKGSHPPCWAFSIQSLSSLQLRRRELWPFEARDTRTLVTIGPGVTTAIPPGLPHHSTASARHKRRLWGGGVKELPPRRLVTANTTSHRPAYHVGGLKLRDPQRFGSGTNFREIYQPSIRTDTDGQGDSVATRLIC